MGQGYWPIYAELKEALILMLQKQETVFYRTWGISIAIKRLCDIMNKTTPWQKMEVILQFNGNCIYFAPKAI